MIMAFTVSLWNALFELGEFPEWAEGNDRGSNVTRPCDIYA